MPINVQCPRCGCGLGAERLKLRADAARENAEAFIARFPFTPKLKETAELLLDGLSNKEIAKKTGVIEQVVKNRFFQIFNITGCGNARELLAMFAFGAVPEEKPRPKTLRRRRPGR